MIDKRFYMDKHGELYDGETNDLVMLDFGYSYDGVGCKKIVDLLNNLDGRNKKISDLIDKNINDLQKRYDFGQEQGCCPMHNIMHTINTLKQIKEEWEEEWEGE